MFGRLTTCSTAISTTGSRKSGIDDNCACSSCWWIWRYFLTIGVQERETAEDREDDSREDDCGDGNDQYFVSRILAPEVTKLCQWIAWRRHGITTNELFRLYVGHRIAALSLIRICW